MPVDLAYKMRNIITHDYSGVNKVVIEETVRNDFPCLYETIEKFLES